MTIGESRRPVAAIVPAKDEEARLGATLAAMTRLYEVDLVVVVDDGSSDGTSQIARDAGAVVVRHERNRGKAAALTTGAAEVARIEQIEGREHPRPLLFVDADLEDSAAELGPVADVVATGRADMSIAILPPQRSAGGGFGLVVGLARGGIERLTGFRATQPLSGMRCLTRELYTQVTPLAGGWGVEVGLTVDALRAGARVEEIPVELHHRVTGRDLRAQLHRARQYRDVWWALARRGSWHPRPRAAARA